MKNRTTLEYLELAETMGVNPEESYLIALLDKIDDALEDSSTSPDRRVRLMTKKAQLKVDLEELRSNPNKKPLVCAAALASKVEEDFKRI